MRAACLAAIAVLASPAVAQAQTAPGLCAAVWEDLSAALSAIGPVSGTFADAAEGGCVIEGFKVDLQGTYRPDLLADRLTLRGSALAWAQDGTTPPERLDLTVEGFRFLIQTGNPQMDYLLEAQGRATGLMMEAALVWSPKTRSLTVERLDIDFPGDNRVALTAQVKGVDLSSLGAAQMSVTSFAVTELDLTVQSHGLFESYLLMGLGAAVLPFEGDMQAAERELKLQAAAGIAALPDTLMPAASKAALQALVEELPNPYGTLTVKMRSEAGFGPARLLGYVMTGMPDSISTLAPLFDGITIDLGWTDASTP